jgi:hypothetical protein
MSAPQPPTPPLDERKFAEDVAAKKRELDLKEREIVAREREVLTKEIEHPLGWVDLLLAPFSWAGGSAVTSVATLLMAGRRAGVLVRKSKIYPCQLLVLG